MRQMNPRLILNSAFVTGCRLLTCTLLGKLALHEVSYNDAHRPQLDTKWSSVVVNLQKVNAIAADGDWLAIGGLSETGAGRLEIWKLAEDYQLAAQMSGLSV